jgi:hypothetical protein
MVPVRTAVPVRAVVRNQIAGGFGSPTVPSGRATRRLWPCHQQAPAVPSAGSGRAIRGVLVACDRGFRRVLG